MVLNASSMAYRNYRNLPDFAKKIGFCEIGRENVQCHKANCNYQNL